MYFSLLVWPILGFLEVYYTYKPFSLTGNYIGITSAKELLAFLATGYMAYTCYWSMVQNAWSMSYQERTGGTLEVSFLSPANRMAMNYGKALGALLQEVWMFCCFCLFILFYTNSIRLVLHITGDGTGVEMDMLRLGVCLVIMVGITKLLLVRAEANNRKNGELQFY